MFNKVQWIVSYAQNLALNIPASLLIFFAETWVANEVLRMQRGGSPELHQYSRRQGKIYMQTDIQGRGHQTVPRTDVHPTSLGPSAFWKGQMYTLWQGKGSILGSGMIRVTEERLHFWTFTMFQLAHSFSTRRYNWLHKSFALNSRRFVSNCTKCFGWIVGNS